MSEVLEAAAKFQEIEGRQNGHECTEHIMLTGKSDIKRTAVWFHANCEYGVIGLRIAMATNMRSCEAVALALTLESEEKLVQYLEKWLDIELDFSPVKQTQIPEASIVLQLTVPEVLLTKSDTSISPPSVVLSFPMTLLLQCPAPDWRDLRVRWQGLHSQLILDRVKLLDQEQSTLEPGALLLLPNSFKKEWQVKLYASGEKLDKISVFMNAVFDPVQMQLSTTSRSEITNNMTDQFPETDGDIYCVVDVVIPADIYLGWRGTGEQFSIAERLRGAMDIYAVTVTIYSGSKSIALGRLISIGDGYAIFIKKNNLLQVPRKTTN